MEESNIDYRKNNKWKVYVHISPSNKYYVGITKLKPIERWGSDGKMYNKQLFYRAIQKYGWENFQHEVIAENLTLEEACQFEMKLIEVLDANGEHGYNGDKGGGYDYREFRNLCGDTFGHIKVVELTDKTYRSERVYRCICDCGNEVFFRTGQLLYTKKYLCCKECEKKYRHSDNVKNFIPNTKIIDRGDYIEVSVNNTLVLCDKKYYELLSKSSLIFEHDREGQISRVKIYNPSIFEKPKDLKSVLFNLKGSHVIFKNMNITDLRENNIFIVDHKTKTKYHHLLNNRNSDSYLIEKKKHKDGRIYYAPTLELRRDLNVKFKTEDNLDDAIKERNRLLNLKYKDNEVLMDLISRFYV